MSGWLTDAFLPVFAPIVNMEGSWTQLMREQRKGLEQRQAHPEQKKSAPPKPSQGVPGAYHTFSADSMLREWTHCKPSLIISSPLTHTHSCPANGLIYRRTSTMMATADSNLPNSARVIGFSRCNLAARMVMATRSSS